MLELICTDCLTGAHNGKKFPHPGDPCFCGGTIRAGDALLGDYVYCKQHVNPHVTGWCTVGLSDKIALKATTEQEARDEVDAMDLPRYGHCDICKKWIMNEEWYKQSRVHGPVRLTCPEHDE